MKTRYILLLPLMIGVISCSQKKKKYSSSDLSFFGLHGKVKTFAEINVGIGLSATATFETFAKQNTNYHEHTFNEAGELIKIENINPSPYAMDGSEINFKRDEDSLTITQTSSKEKYARTYYKAGDTLSEVVYNKIIDDENHFTLEKYKKYVSVKNGKNYLMNAFLEGINPSQIYDEQQYAVIKNQNGYDSLIYLRRPNNDSVLMYSVNYLQYDKNGNWLARQFIKNKEYKDPELISYTIYRRIEYFE
ncbi:hypothetical protein [Ferruginibacter albus]|uniref:hypothetical protein n=1 Tax=Ferruginibacter albus TaxID=2875540 RepID=UPI001CC4D599|nr:hypothetical protein [Ferruginibacter albus]UAY51636.1 hypothetical protein K9M53_13700 [Ferruginibacter albus]